MAKEDIKKAGTEVGHAFKTFGKTFLRSAKTTAEKVDNWAENKEPEENPDSTVYSDGSWKKTGKEIGNAFKGLGSSIIGTAKDAIPDVDNPEEGKDDTQK